MRVIVDKDDHGNDVSEHPFIINNVRSIVVDKTKAGNDYVFKLIDERGDLAMTMLASRVDCILEGEEDAKH